MEPTLVDDLRHSGLAAAPVDRSATLVGMTPIAGSLTDLVDRMLARAEQDHPGVEYSIAIPEEAAGQLPQHADRIHRVVEGLPGFYAGHAYRDRLVDHLALKGWFVMVTPVDAPASVTAYYGDLRSGQVMTEVPAEARFAQE